jgi:hypothetical protein
MGFMDRLYYRFPQKIDVERHYGFSRDLKYLTRVMASMYGKSGHMEIDTVGPNIKRNPGTVKARRDLTIHIVENKLDFKPLSQATLPAILPEIPERGTIDFKVTVGYTYMDKNYDKMSLVDDVFLVRATLDGDLTLKIASIHGQGRTVPEEVADTIETVMEHFKE